MLLGHAAGHPQRVLQPCSQALEALAAQHHARMTPAAVGQRELVQPVREGQSAQADAQLVGHGEVRQPEPAGRVLLREVDLALEPVLGAPLADPPLQRAQHRVGEPLGMAALQLLEHRRPGERWCLQQQRHDLRIPPRRQRIGACSPLPRVLLLEAKPPARSIRCAERTLMPTFAAAASCSRLSMFHVLGHLYPVEYVCRAFDAPSTGEGARTAATPQNRPGVRSPGG